MKTEEQKEEFLAEVPKTFAGLRDACLDEINLLRQGKTTIARAKTIANLSRQVIGSVMVEFTVNKPDTPKQLTENVGIK